MSSKRIKKNAKIVKQNKPSSTSVQATQTTMQRRTHSGPLPSPDVLQGYESILPGLAERIVVMAEKEQSSRINIEKIGVTGVLQKIDRGQKYGTAIAIFAIAVSGLVVYFGHEWGAAISLASLGSIISAIMDRPSKEEDPK